jgi:Undecaprenyl-phosphate glucose phosphotransferase
MVKTQTRFIALSFVLADILATDLSWVSAFLLRFHSRTLLALIPATKGIPPFSRYLMLLPLLSLLWPMALYFHGLYQMKRGRSRIDEFFGIVFSVLVASALALGTTLYIRVYYRYQEGVAPLWEFSQAVFGIFMALDILALNASRWALRAYLQRRWAAGFNVKRVLVAGAGDLGKTVADTILAHEEYGYRVVGFLDDAIQSTYAGLPVLGTLSQAMEVAEAHDVDQVYVALPMEQHARILELIRSVSNECIDIKVVPDLVQYATVKAALEDLDGIPIISLNEVPLRGWNSMLKRLFDMTLGTVLLVGFSPVLLLAAVLVRLKGGKGPVLLRQERMTLDGKTFQIYKFRTMIDEAEKDSGPVWATPEDPRRTPIGIWLRKFNFDELPQFINVVLGDMSLVGPRPERPPFVRQFKERIPQYMLRHRVKSGITGWAQVNGWRGNTSIEKRIEYDLYYIENWSLLLDVKILILTLFRGFGQKHAY